MAVAVRGVCGAGVDYKALVSRGDLDYSTPATRSEEGMAVGNGRMGSLVWTTAEGMHFQIKWVRVKAGRAGVCGLKNPWGSGVMGIWREGKRVGEASGEVAALKMGREGGGGGAGWRAGAGVKRGLHFFVAANGGLWFHAGFMGSG